MNLSHDQERIAKSSAEALSSWRDGLGSVVWVVLGVVLAVALVAVGVALVMMLRRRRRVAGHRSGGASSGLPDATSARKE